MSIEDGLMVGFVMFGHSGSYGEREKEKERKRKRENNHTEIIMRPY